MKLNLFVLVAFLYISTFAQEQIVDTSVCSFINYKINKIHNGNKYLTAFFEKLNKLENNKISKVSVFHFGDSHVAGLSFPNRLEYHFQLNFGNLGREVFSEQPIIKKKRKKVRRKRGDDFDDSFSYYPVTKDTIYSSDSLFIDKDTSWFSLVPIKKSGVYYSIYGNVGKSFSYFSTSALFQNRLEVANPDLAVITLGTNDAYAPKFDSLTFYNNAKELVLLLKKFNPKVNIIITIPAESYIKRKLVNQNIITVKNSLIKIADDEEICCWNFYDIMAKDDKMMNWVLNGLATNDKVHFTKAGYMLMADLIYVAIMKEYENFLLNNRERNE
ncbi:MAG TPA: GDSL-type esterase/lipase family protein [Melioribacteraceae bacterium]|nr:GDSL-type esterase/lipase family protein [Melioribacteraceae bacterium]